MDACNAATEIIKFLSTPSARRATRRVIDLCDVTIISIHALCEEGDRRCRPMKMALIISIHALCEEGDVVPTVNNNRLVDFYPRPLRGGRPSLSRPTMLISYFYPRPLRGGRPVADATRWIDNIFLSTPSARRATSWVRCLRGILMISIHALCEEGDHAG